MPLVEQERLIIPFTPRFLVGFVLLNVPEHVGPRPFLIGFVLLDLLFSVFCRSLFVLYLLAIVLSVLLTDSEYTFGIF
jgi:hypothetical protein